MLVRRQPKALEIRLASDVERSKRPVTFGVTVTTLSSAFTRKMSSCFGTSNRFRFGRFALCFDGKSSATAQSRRHNVVCLLTRGMPRRDSAESAGAF
jgi:hypothetical protein